MHDKGELVRLHVSFDELSRTAKMLDARVSILEEEMQKVKATRAPSENRKMPDHKRWHDDKLLDVLHRRIAGDTLQSVADHYGVTRERIRQVEVRAMNKVENGQLVL